ncbi:MAG: SusC/RagA family TonB-linked outer membrane protein [Candidatus Kapaibacteriota bacterium]
MRKFTTFLRYCVAVMLVWGMTSALALAAGRIVGKATDDDTNAPLGGVSIKVKVGGKVMGAFTGKDGSYEIRNVPAGIYDISASYIGFKTKNAKITVADDADAKLDFKMQLDLLLLEEAVVVGYGTKQRRELTGAIATVQAKELENLPVPSVQGALQGRMSGVQVVQANGMAGGGFTIRVRGVGSIGANSQPLFVVDGIPVTTGDNSGDGGFGANSVKSSNTDALADINMNDIESIDVLKDAAAAAIYGAQAANGVVLITTKRGKAGTTKISANYYEGWVNASNRLPLLNAQEWVDLYSEAWRNDGRTGEPQLPRGITRQQALTRGTDWVDKILRTGRMREASISASGGSDKTQFYLGGTYRNEEGYMIQNDFERIAGRLTVDHAISDALKIGGSISINRNTNNRVPTAWGGGLGAATSDALVIFPERNEDGSLFLPKNQFPFLNPTAQLANRFYRTISTRTLANIYGDLKIPGIEGLSLRSQAALDFRNQEEQAYVSSIIQPNGLPRGDDRRVNVLNWNTETFLTYDTKFADIHKLNIVAGLSAQRSQTREVGIYATNFPNETVTNPAAASGIQGYGSESGFAFLGYFSRLSYTLMDKYLLGASIRYDGSSRFGINNQFGFFPSASLSWIVSQEDFLRGSEAITFLKFGASWGLTGNAAIGDFSWRGTYGSGPGAQYSGQPGTFPTRIENPFLTWERASSVDVAVDFGLLNDRISGRLNYFTRTNFDLLLNVAIPSSSGFGSVLQNIGRVDNSGVEASVRAFIISTPDFSWNTDVNVTWMRNVVVDNAGLPPDAIGGPGETRTVVGQPLGTFFMNRFARVQASDEMVKVRYRAPGNTVTFTSPAADRSAARFIDTTIMVRGGTPLFLDIDGNLTTLVDGKINLNDRVPNGNPYPSIVGGWTNTFNFKGFDLSVLVTFQTGNTIYDDAGKRLIGNIGFGGGWNQMRQTLNRWQKQGDVTDVPRLTLNASSRDINTTRFLYDGSFARLRNVTLGYTLPSEFTSSIGISRLRIYAMIQNAAVLTSFPGWDPELVRDVDAGQAANLGQSVSYLTPPQARQITVGINLDF